MTHTWIIFLSLHYLFFVLLYYCVYSHSLCYVACITIWLLQYILLLLRPHLLLLPCQALAKGNFDLAMKQLSLSSCEYDNTAPSKLAWVSEVAGEWKDKDLAAVSGDTRRGGRGDLLCCLVTPHCCHYCCHCCCQCCFTVLLLSYCCAKSITPLFTFSSFHHSMT